MRRRLQISIDYVRFSIALFAISIYTCSARSRGISSIIRTA